MKLSGLSYLFESMKNQQIQRYKFQFKRNNVIFDVIFFTDVSPFLLLFGARGYNFSFQVLVKPGFNINENLSSEDYYGLVKVLNIQRNDNNKFIPKYFFQDFNESIPKYASQRNVPQPHEIAMYSKDIEEADKIYFFGWKDNTTDGKQVTISNLEKTKKLLGNKAFLTCKSKNISSKWTNKHDLAQKFTQP